MLMKKFFVFLIITCFLATPALAKSNKWTRMVEDCGTILHDVQEMPDGGIPEDLMRKTYAIAIFPNTVSAAFGFGGKYGQGIIMARDTKTGKWSPPAIFTIAGGSIGWQIGGQATDIVLLFMNRRSIDGILRGKLKLGADAAVAAGPVGRSAEAATDTRLGGILSYSRNRGLFIGVNLEGTVITQHWDGNETLYGKSLSADDILVDKPPKMPDCADGILDVLKEYPYKS